MADLVRKKVMEKAARKKRAHQRLRQKLGVAGNNVVGELSHQAVTQPLVEPSRARVEVRDADDFPAVA